jgi:broad specificity phosphatase PhoE
MSQTIWSIRHADRLDFVQPEWFDTAEYRYDPPLSPQGWQQTIALSEQFQGKSIDRIFASPFLRTIQTANAIATSLHLPVSLEWGLCEWLCAEWTTQMPQLTPIDRSLDLYPTIDLQYRSQVLPTYPESIVDLDLRTKLMAAKLRATSDRTIAIVGHKISLLKIATALTGDDRWQDYNLACGESICIEI